jgi:hypothetical protein
MVRTSPKSAAREQDERENGDADGAHPLDGQQSLPIPTCRAPGVGELGIEAVDDCWWAEPQHAPGDATERWEDDPPHDRDGELLLTDRKLPRISELVIARSERLTDRRCAATAKAR